MKKKTTKNNKKQLYLAFNSIVSCKCVLKHGYIHAGMNVSGYKVTSYPHIALLMKNLN